MAEKPPDSLCRGNAAAVTVPRRSQKREIPLHNRGPTSRDLNAGFLRELRTCFVWIQWGFSGGREARPPAASSRHPGNVLSVPSALCRPPPPGRSPAHSACLGNSSYANPPSPRNTSAHSIFEAAITTLRDSPTPPFLSQEESLDVRSQDRVTVTVTEGPGRTRMRAFLHSLPNRLVR